MTTLPEFCKMLTRYDGRDEASISHVGRVAREAGYIVAGKRGRGGPNLDVKSAANLLIALNGAEFPKDAPLAIDRFRSLRLKGIHSAIGMQDLFKDLEACQTFGDALEHVIASRVLFDSIFQVWLLKTKPADLLTDLEADSEEWHQAYENHFQDFISLMFGPSRPFPVSVELSRYFATIKVQQSWNQKTVLEARYYQDDDRIMEGFYGSKSYDRRVICKFGFDTLINVYIALEDKEMIE
jgi:hypothetical protein